MFTLIAISVLSTAMALPEDRPNHEAWAVLGQYASNDDQFSLYSGDNNIGARGLRVGVGLTPHWSVVGSYTRRRVATAYDATSVEGADSESTYERPTFVAAFSAQQITLGPKYAYTLTNMLTPYAVAQGLAFVGTSRLDDNADDPENLNQIKGRGTAFGFVTALGAELTTPKDLGGLRPALFLEVGYNWTSELLLVDEAVGQNGTSEPAPLGDLHFRGAFVQSGIGVRF